MQIVNYCRPEPEPARLIIISQFTIFKNPLRDVCDLIHFHIVYAPRAVLSKPADSYFLNILLDSSTLLRFSDIYGR
ncbi:hypothetical protein A6M21_05050 [Desulfotomaculum copahuensis]|uniref:Uncharacterized protein n=1 Tax=Desulfotomaculum copahuensis TaxID=1838280 RepID=A0A1B7LHT9_9FIRM|nr:hypothetical protein A6M21_05050 [Desulfotomaculum copahuensis]